MLNWYAAPIQRAIQYFNHLASVCLLTLCCLLQIHGLSWYELAHPNGSLWIEGRLRNCVLRRRLFRLKHWSILVDWVVNSHRAYFILCWLRVLTQIYRHRLMLPLVPCCLVQRQVIPEVKAWVWLEVRAIVIVVAPWTTRGHIVWYATHRLEYCRTPAITSRSFLALVD